MKMEKEITKEKVKEYTLPNSELLRTCLRGLERNINVIKQTDNPNEREKSFQVIDDYMSILNDLSQLIEDDKKEEK